jgi:pilus assembly protein CpaE
VRNNGVPLIEQAPKAPITQAIIQLAEALTGEPKDSETADAAKSVKSRWLGLFGGKLKG